jgi:hypothetical protein
MRSSLFARDQRVGEDLGVGGLADGLGLAGLRIEGTKAVKLLLQVERRLEAAALLRQHVQQHRVVGLRLEKLEGLHQQRQVVAVDGTIVLQPELLEEDGGPEQALGGLFGAARHLAAVLPPTRSMMRWAESCRLL